MSALSSVNISNSISCASTSGSTALSNKTLISLGVFSWGTSSSSIPVENTCVSNYITVLSNNYIYSNINPNNYFKIEMVFTLDLPLNTLDPSEIVTLCMTNNNGLQYPPSGTTDGTGTYYTYYFNISMSQGGNMITSPIFPWTINYQTTSYTTSSGSPITCAFIPIGNFFNIATPGVFYKLCLEGEINLNN